LNILPKRGPYDSYKTVFIGKPSANEQSPWCEHTIDINSLPKTNCKQCFSYVLVRNAEFTKAALTDMGAGKEALLVNEFGSKFVKNLKWFANRAKVVSEAVQEIESRMEEDVLANPEADVEIDSFGLQEKKPIAEMLDQYIAANPAIEGQVGRKAIVEMVE
jgi:hypothetical protein